MATGSDGGRVLTAARCFWSGGEQELPVGAENGHGRNAVGPKEASPVSDALTRNRG